MLTSLEVVVVDNDSRDDTAYSVASEFPWVKLIVNRTNAGFAHAINEGVKFTSGETCSSSTPTRSSRGRLAALREPRARPSVGMLGCKLVQPDGSLDQACKRGFPTPLRLARLLHRAQPARSPQPPLRRIHRAASRRGRDGGGRRRQRRLHARPARGGRRGRAARRALLALHGGPRLVLPVPPARVAGPLLARGRGGPREGRQRRAARRWRPNYAFHRGMWLFYRKHHAPHRSAALSALVWLGVWSKFVTSATANALRARRERATGTS